jgi:hypothetical protein
VDDVLGETPCFGFVDDVLLLEFLGGGGFVVDEDRVEVGGHLLGLLL